MADRIELGLDVPATVADVERHGHAVAPGLLSLPQVEALKDEFDRAIAGLDAYAYPFGEQRRIGACEPLAEELFPATVDLLMRGPLGEVCVALGAGDDDDLLVWSHEHIRDESAIYGQPHFDRRRQFKIFVYLNDVTTDDGPTHVAHEGRDLFYPRWIRAWGDALGIVGDQDEIATAASAVDESSGTYRSVVCAVERPRESLKPLVGPAGSVVFFDTMLAHFGGLVAPGAARLTVRRHCLLG